MQAAYSSSREPRGPVKRAKRAGRCDESKSFGLGSPDADVHVVAKMAEVVEDKSRRRAC